MAVIVFLTEVVGVGLIAGGLWMVYPPLALIVTGAFLVLTVQTVGRRER